MRSVTPRPVLLVFVLLLAAGAVVAIEFGLGGGSSPTGSASPPEREEATPAPAEETTADREEQDEPRKAEETTTGERTTPPPPDRAARDRAAEQERVSRKEEEFRRAVEIVGPSGFVNADGVSLEAARGEKVVLLDFWTYSCINCQNTQPYLNAWHERYADDGLLVVGVHTPEFEFEKDYENVRAAVAAAGIEYPVVLDNDYATWRAYDQRYWPTMYLIDADGFVRYRTIGEGAYEETEAEIRKLLAEKDRAPG